MSHDLAQEAFSKLWQNCAKVIPESAKGYVFKTANNLLINEYNHQKVVLNHQRKPQQQKTIESPEFLLEEQEFKQKLEETIAALPEKQRVVFLLSRIDKKTYKEIAEIIGISKQAVEKRMYNALDTLREVVSERIR
jgi:RNA polymerase sigma-70 factor (ECF subfamily)